MRLAGQIVSLLLTNDGFEVLSLASVKIPAASKLLTVTVEETDDMGLWLRMPKGGPDAPSADAVGLHTDHRRSKRKWTPHRHQGLNVEAYSLKCLLAKSSVVR